MSNVQVNTDSKSLESNSKSIESKSNDSKINQKLSQNTLTKNKSKINPLFMNPLLMIGILFGVLWFIPAPEGLSIQAWHLFAIFFCTVIGIITNALPMGAFAIIALALATITHTLSQKEALSGFSSHISWLILMAFILARGFIKTGLGTRIAYYFVLNMGKSTMGLSYGLMATEFILAPFTPSNTARGAGIVYPIVAALSKEYGSSPEENTERKLGAYLMKLCYQGNIITSAMFLTATAGNPLVASLASELGVTISWTSWALAGIVPGLISLLLLPWILMKLYPPGIIHTPEAPQFARTKLDEMGPIKRDEWVMLGTFFLLLCLWIFGSQLKVDATVAAILGLAILLVTRVLTFDDVLKEHNAWHTFIWLTTLLTLCNFLTEFGMMSWFGNHMQNFVGNSHWIIALSVVALVYFYTHYVFASMTAHISALYLPFAWVAVTAGAPPMLTALVLAYFSCLCAGITHYGTGTGPVYFGSNYVKVKVWWSIGVVLSLFNILLWSILGPLWWKTLGLW